MKDYKKRAGRARGAPLRFASDGIFFPENPSPQTYCTLPWADDALMPSSLRCPPLCVFVAADVGTRAYPHPARYGTQRCASRSGRGAPLTARPVDITRPPNVVADYASCAASFLLCDYLPSRYAVKEAARPTRRTTSRRRRAHPDVWVRCRPTSSVPPLPARPLRRARDRSGNRPASCCVLVRRRRPLDRPAAHCAARLPIPCPAAHPPDPPPPRGGRRRKTAAFAC